MKKVESDNYTESKIIICDWTDKKKNLILYRMLKFNIKHGMGFDKVKEIKSFKQSNCLKKTFLTQKRNRVENDFEKDF